MKKLFFLLALLVPHLYCNAQCEDGEVEVIINVITDNWGYECYWQLQPEGNGCGEEPLMEGGNIDQIECGDGSPQVATGGNGYANFTTYEIDPICLTLDENYTIHFIDAYGDGGTTFEVFQGGIQTGFYVGTGTGNDFTFTAGDLTPAFIPGDRPCDSFLIEENSESLILDNTEATASPGEVQPPLIACGAYGAWCASNNGASNTMWVSFTPETDGAYEISTCNEGNTFDTALAVYSADDCTDFSTFTLISANDDAYIGCGAGSTGFASICYVSCLTVGQEYYIQVDGWGGGDTGITEVTVTSYNQDPDVNAIITDIQCANVKGETGSRIIPQVNGLGINYNIMWSGPNDFSSTERVITDINAGDYTCIITNECGVSLTEIFTINSATPVSPDFTITNTSCVGAADGSLAVTASGGNDPYQFLWSGEDNFLADSSFITDLSEGTYSLLITDDNDCEYTSAVTIDSDNILEFSLGDNQTICLNEFLVLEGPVGFLLYEWQDGSENSTFIVNGADGIGDYSINLTVTNEIGCEHTDVVNVTVDNCLGLEELADAPLAVYPNPVEDMLYLDISQALLARYSDQDLALKVTDMRGAHIMNSALNSTNASVDLGELSPGIYTIQLYTNSEVSQPLKIVKK